MQLIQASRDTLLRPLTTVAGIVERRSTMPILANILIRRSGNVISFVGSDNEVQITAQIELEQTQADGLTGDPVLTTVAARKLLDILRALPDSRDVILDLDDNKVLVASGRSRFALQTLSASDFPVSQLPEQWEVSFTMRQKDLRHLFNCVHFAMSHQDIRYYLNGLLLAVEPGFVRVVATDGHRLAHGGLPLEGISGEQDVIIPRKTIHEMQRLLDDSDDDVQIDIGTDKIRFVFDNVELVSKLVEGKFPDFTRVIPQGYERHFDINREKMQGCLQRAAILTTDKFKGVRLQINDGTLVVTASNAEQEEAREEIEIDYSQEPVDIGFNVTYLLDVLANIKEDTLRWSMQPDGNSSTLITLPGDDHFKYVVMPMRI
ncbi:MAG TPA: DNA polymerase III subunit beta [Burkholderiaceae bacterium]|nr:DNA polymerase III subunit beta [Burkholderiaceae bacterium]